MEIAIGVALLVGVYVLLRVTTRSHPHFSIRVGDGVVRVERGDPPPRFLRELRELAEHDSVEGAIHGLRSSRGIRLEFEGLAPADEQRIRNIWSVSDRR